MTEKSPFDDVELAAIFWARFRRMMRLMLLITIAVVILAVALLYDGASAASIYFYIIVAVGTGLTMLLTATLMGLVFLSNQSGHDANLYEAGEKQEAGQDSSDPELADPELADSDSVDPIGRGHD